MASLTRPSAGSLATSTSRRSPAPPRALPMSSMMDAVGAALTRVLFSPTSRDNANVSAGSSGFTGRLPARARHGAARRPFGGDAGVFRQSSVVAGASAAASMSSVDDEDEHGGGGGVGDYLSGGLGRVFAGQAGMDGGSGAPTTGAGWAGEGAHRRTRRPGTGGGF